MNSNLDYLRQYAPIIVNIQGQVSFSHISKMYEGEELIAANKRAQEHGGRPSNRPYCTLSIDNPRILYPEMLPQDVVTVMQQRFKPVKGTNTIRYYATSKSPNLPPIAYSAYAGAELAGQGIADKMHPLGRELASGLTVTVGARIFDTPAGVGVGIEYVLIDEPIRYYESNSLAEVLASYGVLYVAPDADKAQTAETPQRTTGKAVVENNTYASGGSIGTYPNDGQVSGEMPYDPALYYENNTMPVTVTMQNTAPQGNMNNNGVRQNAANTAEQPQGNMNRSGVAQNVYKATMQPQMNRNANAQMNQAAERPMVRMGQPQQMAG
ncbi:MAG: hypothetical protein K2P35_11165 [Lachnospiraceae bacterium]|nr:hypothetical protein [Lachnospiraceae bacterium]NDO52071.1 hypothetical protein [Lachnospiraceae bacterium MD335]